MTIENWISLALVMVNGAALGVLGAPVGTFQPVVTSIALVLAGMTASALAFLRSLRPTVKE